jgi:hypothetical protein
MKMVSALFIIYLLIIETGCRKETTNTFVCPEVILPQNYAALHSGDTISILVYLPPAIQRDSFDAFVEVYNGFYQGTDTLNMDTTIYPVFGSNHYGTAKVVLKAARNGIDSIYIAAGIGGFAGMIECRAVTISIQP